MKKPLDVSKLVDQTFSDKKFGIDDILKEIDLVMEGITNYEYKRDTDAFEENVDSLRAHFNGNSVDPRNPRNDPVDFDPQSLHSLARKPNFNGVGGIDEAGESKSVKEYKIRVPNFLDLIVKNQSTPRLGSSERNLVNGIIKSIPGKDWKARINHMNALMKDSASYESNKGFRNEIASLMTLSTFAKIAKDFKAGTAGSIMENFMAVLLGGKFDVEKDKTIYDFTGYSLKFIKDSLTGSKKLLADATSGGQKVKYIIIHKNEKLNSFNFYRINIGAVDMKSVQGGPTIESGGYYVVRQPNNELDVNVIIDLGKDTKFNFSFSSLIKKWGIKPAASLVFESSENIQKLLFKKTSEIDQSISFILENMNALNYNLTTFLAVSEDSKNQNAGNEALKNADNIKESVIGTLKSEK